MGSVGTNDVVEFINGGFQVFNKTDGTARTALTTDSTFWTNKAGIDQSVVSPGLSDTRIIFDHATSRWFAAEINTASTGNQILIARSDSDDPTGTWKGTNFAAPTGFADFPTLSLDQNGIYLGTNNFTEGTQNATFTGVSLISIPKSDILMGTPTVDNRSVTTDSGANRGYTLQGVLDFGASVQGTVVAMSATDNTSLKVTKINNPNSANATFSSALSLAITNSPNSPNYAPQPDGTFQIDNGDNRISGQVVKAGNYIYLTQSIQVGQRAGIKLTVLNADGTAVLAEQTFSDPAGIEDYYYPSVSANANGTFVIGFSRSGTAPGDFISGYARVGTFDGAAAVFNPTDTLLQPGLGNYHLFGGNNERWGDYSATVLDPTDPNTFWTFQEYAMADNTWGTSFSRISVGGAATPEPGTLVLLAIGGVPFLGGMARRKRRAKSKP